MIFQVITEIVSPGFLLDDEQPVTSSDTVDDCSSYVTDETTQACDNDDAAVPSAEQSNQSGCDCECHGDNSDRSETNNLQRNDENCSFHCKMDSPITWKKCLERAPYADEESFSLTEGNDEDSQSDKEVAFICHM